MAIPFACECGKKMTAKEEYAGRRLRCPECQRVVQIPKLTAATPVTGNSGMMSTPQPTLTREEVAALMNTPAPSRTIPVPPPPRRSDLFPKPQIPAAAAKPAAKPAAPVVAPVAAVKPKEEGKPMHPWVDPTATQTATPWLPGDEERFQKNVKPAREWEWPIGWIVALLAVAGLAAWVLTPL